MKTWTFETEDVVGVVTGDNVVQARIHLSVSHKIHLENKDLVPLPTHHRHIRILKKKDNTDNFQRDSSRRYGEIRRQ